MKYIIVAVLIFFLVALVSLIAISFYKMIQKSPIVEEPEPEYDWMGLSDEELAKLFDKRMKEHNEREITEDGYVEEKAMSEEDFAIFQELARRGLLIKEE
jgi:hypothetical protein